MICALPYVVVPILIPCKEEKEIVWYQRYAIKVNVWIWIFSYVGNYFWTHYFYKVLGASYSFPQNIDLNGVPFFLYLMTHGYFNFYHVITNLILRRFWSGQFYRRNSRFSRLLLSSLVVFIMSSITAFMETFTISSVPYYSHKDKVNK